jgi:dUTP pyrophosphatase
MKVKVKRLHPNAKIPQYSKEGDAGLDLVAVSKRGYKDANGCRIITYGTGLAFEIPEGYVGLIFPRSSISKKALSLTNAVGVIDSGYRGEVMAKFRIDANARPMRDRTYVEGDRIAQMIIVPYPQIELEEVGELNESDRGSGGFGSTGD